MNTIQANFLKFLYMDDMLYNRYSVLIQTKLSIINALHNLKDEARKSLLDEVTPILEYLTNTFSLVDRNEVKREKEEQEEKNRIQEEAVLDMLKSTEDSVGSLNDILLKLQNKINQNKTT